VGVVRLPNPGGLASRRCRTCKNSTASFRRRAFSSVELGSKDRVGSRLSVRITGIWFLHTNGASMKNAYRIFLLLTLLCLAGCGASSNFDQPINPIAPFTPPVYQIGVLAPLEAGSVEFGQGMRNSVILAAEQWNDGHPLGPLFTVVAVDDSSDPAVGLANVQQLLDAPNLVGVVGTYNSGVASAVLPTLEAAGIPLLSPANTDPTLTLGNDPQNPVRPYQNYFRLVASDNQQGPVLATYAFSRLGVSQVAILSEEKAVSQGLANDFSTKFQELGGTILEFEIVPEGTSDYSALLATIAPSNPQLLFYAGEVPNASIVRDQATQAGIAVPLMGGDGVKAESYINDATESTEGDIASTPGAAAELLPSEAPFVEAYLAAGFSEPASFFGPYAFDAANLLMEASLQSGLDSQQILSFLNQVDTTGVTGRLSFDSFGDTLNLLVTIFVVENGVFVPKEVVEGN
jgi:branched-chain amino acid transport system substrate-binding protein